MTQRFVDISTEDGICKASLHVPDGAGPWPAVLMFPDAGGLREAFYEMGDQLAGLGYLTLVPEIYYRVGGYAPFDMRTVFADPDERTRLVSLMHGLHADMVVRDAHAYIAFLTDQPETRATAVGTTGYCLGGRLSLTVAGHLGDRVAGAASFHGGNIAAQDDPDSPHLLAAAITAHVYVAGATEDTSFPAEQRDRLDQALTAAGVQHTIETYPAGHGFAVPDNPTYDPAAAARHWEATAQFFAACLTK